ncbi:PPC domain-containing protein [Anaerosalibacter sp. Marseille-P3206]|uniref:PPC domain-containing protein n=1 Tax=Anaerosalibacter sp. Marseille-P3206 TaxID=1871005 RepID=UPI00098551CF|nr:PPC domain-containing protein [Anaerosalibacter sp. Marseille-P3206]
MKKSRLLLSIILSISILLLNCSVFAEPIESELGFNEYGFKTLDKQLLAEEKLLGNMRAKSSNWETFPSKTNIDLEKVWTVKFSSTVNMENLDGIAIEKDNQFIPVRITKTKYDTITVQPIDSFSGNSEYTMRIFLNNGRKYKMNFYTKPEYRNADIEPNDNFMQANEIYLNETIIGELKSQNDNVDFYKIEIPSSGKLRIDGTQLDGGEIGITLYNEYGTDSNYIARDYSGQKVQIISGLEKGTYYIGVYNRSGYGAYELNLDFSKQTIANDNASNNYIKAEKISINDRITGHIGYTRSNGNVNTQDFYKIEIPSSGKLRIDGTQLDGGEIGITLYNEYGTDSNYIARDYSSQKVQIISGLDKGTYYIGVYNRSGYGAYELNLDFSKQTIANDNASNNYIKAEKISINDRITGHIGYTRSNGNVNTQDFYKIEIPSSGKLRIDGTQLDGGEIGITLYNEYGTDSNYITRDYSSQKVQIISDLDKGTYYIGVYNRSGYGAYELNLNFKE